MGQKRTHSISPPPPSALSAAAGSSSASTAAAVPSTGTTRFYPLAGPAPKKAKVVNELGEEVEAEKRAAVFKKKCPKNIEERVERVMEQRFFCIDRTRSEETSENFKVLGSTGNVYTVSINTFPQCTCPDGAKGNHCKHILFVMLKILQVPRVSSNLWFQKALLTSEVAAIFANAPRDHADATTSHLRTAFKRATGQYVPADEDLAKQKDTPKKRLPQEGDSCPICYEDFPVGKELGLVFCESIQGCGNGVHTGCFDQWARTTKKVTCIYCRAPWEAFVPAAASGSGGGPSYSSEGYLNLAGAAGISQVRDTSSYYNGPRKGEKYYGGGYGGYGRW